MKSSNLNGDSSSYVGNQFRALLDSKGKVSTVRSRSQIKNRTKEYVLPIPEEYFEQFPDIGIGTIWNVSVNSGGTLTFCPIKKK